MWIDWENPNNVDFLKAELAGKSKLFDKRDKRTQYNHNKELVEENRRLWIELKEKNDLMIALRDDIYYKQQDIKKLEKCRDELEKIKNDENYFKLIKDLNKMKSDLQDKNNLITILQEMVENLCDEVLQNERVDYLEEEIARMQAETQSLSKENSDIRVKLKIVEHDNEKLQTQRQQLEDENHCLKKKLEKTARRLKEKENSLLSFKNFHELITNFQNRFSRTKSENVSLKNALERMSNLALNYDKLEKENIELKKMVKQLESNNEDLKNGLLSMQEKQLKWKEEEEVTKPALIRENQNFKEQLSNAEEKVQTLKNENYKLRTNLKIYEKLLIESKAYAEKQEKAVQQYENMKNTVHGMKNVVQNSEIEIGDLKKQLQLQDTMLLNLRKENKELKLNIKQYESQIQMNGKVYKLAR